MWDFLNLKEHVRREIVQELYDLSIEQMRQLSTRRKGKAATALRGGRKEWENQLK